MGIFESDSAQRCIEALARIKDGEHDGLVADQAHAFVDFAGVAAPDLRLDLARVTKKLPAIAQSKKALEIDVPSIHHVEGSRFANQPVEQIDFVVLAVADMDKRRDIASQVLKRVQLDSCFGGTERGPRKQRQAQIDGSGIESINGVFQVDSKRLVGIEPSRHRDQTLCEIAVDPPVASCVGVGQGVARHGAAKAQVIELKRLARRQASISRSLSRKVSCANAIDRY